jgi:hypothetical protein
MSVKRGALKENLMDALKTREDRLRVAEARLKSLKMNQPNSGEITRWEAIVKDLKS